MRDETGPNGADPFARQLEAGFVGLRFAPALEKQYRSFVLARQRSPAQVCVGIGLAVWAVFAVLDIERIASLGLWPHMDWLVWLWLGTRWSVLGLLVAAILFLRTGRDYDRLLWIGYMIFGLAVVVTSAIGRSKGAFVADSSAIIVVMASFLPLGLSFRRGLVAAVVIAGGCVGSLWGDDLREATDRAQLAAMVLLAVPVAAIGGYLRDYSERESFLLMGMFDRQAGLDSLTGLPNRRALLAHAATVMAREELPLVVAMVDVDHFKPYNDHYGHLAGDAALCRIGGILAGTAEQAGDMAARIGGEEFCLVLCGVTPEEAGQRLAAALEMVRGLQLSHAQSPFGILTFSAGAVRRRSGEDFTAVLGRADAALYEIKRGGRNAVGWH